LPGYCQIIHVIGPTLAVFIPFDCKLPKIAEEIQDFSDDFVFL